MTVSIPASDASKRVGSRSGTLPTIVDVGRDTRNDREIAVHARLMEMEGAVVGSEARTGTSITSTSRTGGREGEIECSNRAPGGNIWTGVPGVPATSAAVGGTAAAAGSAGPVTGSCMGRNIAKGLESASSMPL
ncbi:hypothetical protein VTJ04DRAFT_10871 [Mycothermus thermophilus]|uniref:uncharacterized protein n=1 Tax=Humicola insolens TaxID=85995 RepID=UPI003742CDF4